MEAEKDGQDIEVNGVTISSNVKYNYITSDKDYAKAIDKKLKSNNDGTKLNGNTVELGEKLYNGDLKKSDNGDNFGRPGSTWTYKSSEIGKYADSADGEWTAKVTNKALYDAAGSDAYDNYQWTVTATALRSRLTRLLPAVTRLPTTMLAVTMLSVRRLRPAPSAS